MARTRYDGRVGVVWTISVAVLGVSLALAGSPANAQEPPSYVVRDFTIIPRPWPPSTLLTMEAVQEELRLTEVQKKQQEAIAQGRAQKLQQARRDHPEAEKFRESLGAILKETETAIQEILTPDQRQRLDQIQIQLTGPAAFAGAQRGRLALTGPNLSQRLKLSDDQDRRVQAIVDEGMPQIINAARFVIPLDSKQGPPTAEAIRALAESPAFREAKEKARQAGRDARAAAIQRIEEVLTDAQRQEYHTLLGAPFDLSRLRGAGGAEDERAADLRILAGAFGVGGQRADPSFETRVARPAYADGARHPRVLFDEAHHNFHTAGGRYKPFADLITSDGYQVIPSGATFSRAVLQNGDLLVIANAMGVGQPGPGSSNSAFTEAECDTVRDWVEDGGSLLLITDHSPFGAAAEPLAKRLGVEISKWSTADPANSEGNETWLVFTRQNQLLGDHPITRGRNDSERVNRVQTFTGTSIKGPEGSIPILRLADTALDRPLGDGTPVSAAGRAQGIAFHLGKGRVVVLGEAAELSAQVAGPDQKFGMNVAGLDNRQMALNIMHWLSGLLEP
jgi:hypothetical protein